MPSFAFLSRLRAWVVLALAALSLAACQGTQVPKDLKPVSNQLLAKMAQLNMDPKAPIYVRGFKESSDLEVWKERRDGSYALLTSYKICKWSGQLGPKIKEGDRQAPEGFYTITRGQMNPNSNYYLSFNVGYPNAYDRSLGRTGTNIMVHGACSSAGCYSMTDQAAGEIFALARDAFIGGQRSFEVHLFPFHMTPENLARHRDDPNMPFWRMLKEGDDHFQVTHRVPQVGVCGKRYVFDVDSGGVALNASAPCPPYTVPASLDMAVKTKQAQDQVLIADLSAKYEVADKLAAQKAADDAARLAAAKADAARVAQAPDAASAYAGTASLDIGGVPAPGVPLPVRSPLRPAPVFAPAPPVEEAQPSFWQRIKKKLVISG